MHTFDSIDAFSEVIAAAADLCMKPWKHAVIPTSQNLEDCSIENHKLDLSFNLQCRTIDGNRCQINDLELEIYSSGKDLNIIISWLDQPEKPILWQGHYSVWMDANSGQKCSSPANSQSLEAFARRLRSLLMLEEEI